MHHNHFHQPKRLFAVLLVVISAGTGPVFAADSGIILGGALGGGAGAAVGSSVGGRDGAIIGGALGAAVGVALTQPRQTVVIHEHRRYVYAPRHYDDDDDHGWHRGHGKHGHGHGHDR